MAVLVKPKPLADLTVRDFKMLINGKWVAAVEGKVLERIAPSHGVVVSRYPAGTKADTELAIAAARQTFDAGIWANKTGAERSNILLKEADLIASRSEELAYLDAIEAGKPITQVRGEIGGAVDIWRYAAALARDLHGESYNTLGDGTLGVVLREAIGVVSMITPWNFPFLIVSQKLPFALAAGCSCVVKPSELTSGSTLLLGMAMTEIVDALSLDLDVVMALLDRGGPLGQLLKLVERPDRAGLAEAGIDAATYWQAQLHAYHWAIQVSRNL